METTEPATRKSITTFSAVTGGAWKRTGPETLVPASTATAHAGSPRLPSIVGSEMASEGTVTLTVIGGTSELTVGIGSTLTQPVAKSSVMDLCPPAILAGS